MSGPVHLLRSFTEWYRDGVPVTTVPEARAYVEYVAGLGFDRFQTVTSRMPRRAAELEGGSVFFVKAGHTLFRMPFKQVEMTHVRRVVIEMRPELIEVERARVGRVRGWRYLEDRAAPADIERHTDNLPTALRRELSELGL